MEPDRGETQLTNRPERWNYDTQFRHYLLLLARSKENGLEDEKNFPRKIELNPVWHDTFNAMREETRDGKERLALVGVDPEMVNIKVQTVFGVGDAHSVPSELIIERLQRARKLHNVSNIVTFIHSHPQAFPGMHKFAKYIPRKLDLVVEGFSPGDIHQVLQSSLFLPAAGMVSEFGNYFMFKTRQTPDISNDSPLISGKNFQDYWLKKYGKYVNSKDGTIFIPYSPLFTMKDLNREIAKHHNVLLYHGRPNEDLTLLEYKK